MKKSTKKCIALLFCFMLSVIPTVFGDDAVLDEKANEERIKTLQSIIDPLNKQLEYYNSQLEAALALDREYKTDTSVVYKWIAPDDGLVSVSGSVIPDKGNEIDISLSIRLDSETIWQSETKSSPVEVKDLKDIKVSQNDCLYFIAAKKGTIKKAEVTWQPTIAFTKAVDGLKLNISDAKEILGANLNKDNIIENFDEKDSFKFEGVDFDGGYKTIEFNLATCTTGSRIEVRQDSISGTVIGSLILCNTEGYDKFEDQVCAITETLTGKHDIYITCPSSKDKILIKAVNLLKKEPRGATMPFITLEAESQKLGVTVDKFSKRTHPSTVDNNAKTNTPQQKAVQSASGKCYVNLDAQTEFVEFTSPIDCNRVVLRFTIPKGSKGTLSMYLNGTHNSDIELDSTYCFDQDDFYQRSWDEKIISIDLKKGDKLRFQKDPADKCKYYGIDLADFEMAPKAADMPEGYLSITDFGAVADDNKDDTQAIRDTLAAAKAQGKNVWFPVGQFLQNEKIEIPAGVSIKGAGIWYTELHCPRTCPQKNPWGGYIGFFLNSETKISDMVISGESKFRDDQGIAIMGRNDTSGLNCTIDNVWFKNMSTVVGWAGWSNSVIKNCRIRGTYADAIHFGDLPQVNNYAINNHIRGCGDDGIAVVIRTDYSQKYNQTATNLVARFNTIVGCYWGRGMSIVGGTNVIYTDNIIDSIYLAGLIITEENLGESPATPIENVKFQRNTIRNASHDQHNHAGIHMWLWTNPIKNVKIEVNEITEGSAYGIEIDGGKYGDELGRTQFNYNDVTKNKNGSYANYDPQRVQPIMVGNTGF